MRCLSIFRCFTFLPCDRPLPFPPLLRHTPLLPPRPRQGRKPGLAVITKSSDEGALLFVIKVPVCCRHIEIVLPSNCYLVRKFPYIFNPRSCGKRSLVVQVLVDDNLDRLCAANPFDQYSISIAKHSCGPPCPR